MRETTFDTETTGLDPGSGHRIVEIGCVELIDKVRTGRFFHAYINPERDIPYASTNIHGLTGEFLSDKPIFTDIAEEFLNFIGKDKLVIHNAAFDLKFINFELEKQNFPLIPHSRAIDTLIIARKKFPGAKVSLDALCNKFGIDLSKREKHGALLDAELLADVYLELLGGAQEAMQLGVNVDMQDFGDLKKQPKLKSREFKLTEEEIRLHKEFLDELTEPMWQC